MSYDNQIGNFEQYIETLKNVSTYNPNEVDLKVTALRRAPAACPPRATPSTPPRQP
jgi:hypothetical protein